MNNEKILSDMVEAERLYLKSKAQLMVASLAGATILLAGAAFAETVHSNIDGSVGASLEVLNGDTLGSCDEEDEN